MSDNVVECKPTTTQIHEPNASQSTDAQDQASSKGLPTAFGGIFDVKVVVSLAGAFAFVFGWIYNLGFFFVLNYDFMSVLTINDYVVSTLSALPLSLFLSALGFLTGPLFSHRTDSVMNAVTNFGIKSGWKPERIETIIFSLFLLVAYVPFVILQGLRGYWESVFFLTLGPIGAIVIFASLFHLSIRFNFSPVVGVYAAIFGFGFQFLAFMGATGAGEARNTLKAGFLETKVSSTTQETEVPYLVRSLSAGAVVFYPQVNRLAFIPRERIQYYSSAVKVNDIFNWNQFRLMMQR